MKIPRVYTGDDGLSHFDEVDAGAETLVAGGRPPTVLPADGYLVVAAASTGGDWHPAPRHQLGVLLKGEVTIEVEDGERRHLRPGDLCRFEDVEGRGHLDHYESDGPRSWLIIFV